MTVDPDDSMAGAGITAKERLQNIETMLARIDTKMDTKLDAFDVRIRALETGQTQPIRQATDSIEQMQRAIDTIRTRLWMATGALAVLVFVINFGIHEQWF